MIITVTMNPAIDKTVDIDSFEHGGLNRITDIVRDAGGKGINVSKTIHHLGGTSLATGFLAGSAGDMIEQTLAEYGIRTDFIRVGGETRTNTKVVEKNGTVTELNEPGPVVTEENLAKLIGKLEEYASADTLVVLAGSVPAGVDKTVYRTITEKMHAKGASVLLDADGELFVQALKAEPDIIKPNRLELEEYFRHTFYHAPESSEGSVTYQTEQQQTSAFPVIAPQKAYSRHSDLQIAELGKQLLDQGIGFAAISMGSEGALFISRNETLKCPGLQVKTHSTVGAGDAMVAALAYGWEQKLSFRDCASLGMAASAGAVTTVGTKPPAREVVDELLRQVRIETLELSKSRNQFI